MDGGGLKHCEDLPVVASDKSIDVVTVEFMKRLRIMGDTAPDIPKERRPIGIS